MPKITKSKPVKKVTKQKLSKEQRSQIARDRWAKIKAGNATQEAQSAIEVPGISPIEGVTFHKFPEEAIAALDALPPVTLVVEEPKPTPAQPEITIAPVVTLPSVPTPAPVIAPTKAPKQKRYTGPKEFSGALKAAEKRLAKAINERAEAMGKLAGLNAEIPSLLQIINALKGSGNGPAPYDLSALNGAFQAPVPQTANPLAAIQAAMDAAAQPPVFKASGGAVQLSPDVVGTLEGPEDDDSDIDKYITGASGPVAEGKWIGG